MRSTSLLSTDAHRPIVKDDQSIGAILVESGRLDSEAVASVVELQQKWGLRFGDAALRLALVTPDDIEFAISRQFNYSPLSRGQSAVSEELIAAYAPDAPEVEALRALRGNLMLQWFETDLSRKTLAIISAERTEGRSFLAANLAIVFSQIGLRTLLIDADMRNPSQHRLFGLDNQSGLSTLLTGRGGLGSIQQIPAMRDLFVLPVGLLPPNPSELLARPAFPSLLKQLAGDFDIVLLDTPAAAGAADAQTVTMRAGAALIVVRKNVSRHWMVRRVAEKASQTSAAIIGTVLSDF